MIYKIKLEEVDVSVVEVRVIIPIAQVVQLSLSLIRNVERRDIMPESAEVVELKTWVEKRERKT